MKKWLLVLLSATLAGASFAACGSDDASAPAAGDAGFADALDDPNAVDLHFDPPEATLTVDGTGPKSQAFVLRATANGITSEVTPESLAFDRPDVAKIGANAPATLTASGVHAGTGTLRAIWKGKEATAKLHVIVKIEDVAPGVDPAAIAALEAAPLPADAALTSLLYPYDQTLWPLGLTSPLMLWNAPGAADVYRVHLEQSNFVYDGFTSVAPPAQVRVPQTVWDRITASNVGDPIQLELSRWDAAAKAAFSSTKQSWPIAPASLRGAIYYWTTSSGGHMSRIRPGTGAAPEVLNGGKCMGCHAVSADGTTLVASIEDGVVTPSRAWQAFSLPNVTNLAVTSDRYAGNVAVNPDGRYVVYGNAPGNEPLAIAETKTAQVVAQSGLESVPLAPGNTGLMMPAFSPGGRLLAAVEGAGSTFLELKGDAARLTLQDFDPQTVKFTNYRGLATATQFPAGERALGYPSFTPDSQWIGFHVGDYPTGCDAQGCDDAAETLGQIWLQNVGGAPPVRLDRLSDSSLNAADRNRTYEPTFNPIERGGYFWVVVTSARDWGNKLTGAANNGKKRLWVGGIDKAPGAGDPSHPAFFLEGQEETTTNMRGFWALASCTPTSSFGPGAANDAAPACGAGFECCSGFCDQGKCVDTGSLSCAGIGDVCTADADCCNAPSVQCVEGTCRSQGPK
jgi:hypothetical protein